MKDSPLRLLDECRDLQLQFIHDSNSKLSKIVTEFFNRHRSSINKLIYLTFFNGHLVIMCVLTVG